MWTLASISPVRIHGLYWLPTHHGKRAKRRIALALRAFWSLKFILLDKKLNRRIKFEALASCVFPCLIYGCQTCNLTRVQKKHLQVCQRKIQGNSLRDRIPNTRIRELAKTDDMAKRAEVLKWECGGHVTDGRRFLQCGIPHRQKETRQISKQMDGLLPEDRRSALVQSCKKSKQLC